MTDEELVKRLRNAKATQDFRHTLEDEAADRIEALTEQLKTVLDREAATHFRHDAKTDELEAKLAKAVEAAKPLAAMAERYDPEDDDGDLECWSGLAVPKIKHIRALRTAIADIKIECQE